MKTKLMFSFMYAIVIFGCGGSPEVGSGANFSILPSTPEGLAFAQAILRTTGSIEFKESPERDDGSLVNDYKGTCPSGGTATSHISRENPDNFVGTQIFNVSFQDCGVAIALNNVSYSEVIQGKVHLQGNNEAATYNVGLSVSGDIGFSVECDIEYRKVNDQREYTGSCIFLDSAGTRIEMLGSELQRLFASD